MMDDLICLGRAILWILNGVLIVIGAWVSCDYLSKLWLRRRGRGRAL